MASLSETDWLAELERLAAASRDRSDEGWTVAEWAAKLGCGTQKARDILRLALNEGRLKVGRRPLVRMDGAQHHTPVYALTPTPPAASAPTSRRRRGGSSRD